MRNYQYEKPNDPNDTWCGYGDHMPRSWCAWAGHVKTCEPPWVKITGLDFGVELELAWWDDHRGCFVGDRVVSTNGEFNVQAPGTEPDGKFGRSIAFLIQPKGYTPQRYFEPLPNELIGLIDVQAPVEWHEETPKVRVNTAYTYVARAKVANAEKSYPEDYYFRWRFEDPNAAGGEETFPSPWENPPLPGASGWHQIDYLYESENNLGKWRKVQVDVYEDPEGNSRVTGDIIHVSLCSPE